MTSVPVKDIPSHAMKTVVCLTLTKLSNLQKLARRIMPMMGVLPSHVGRLLAHDRTMEGMIVYSLFLSSKKSAGSCRTKILHGLPAGTTWHALQWAGGVQLLCMLLHE